MASSPSTVRRVRPADLARELGVTRQGIHDLIRRDIISTDADGFLDADLAKIAILNRVRPSGKAAQGVLAGASSPAPSIPVTATLPQPAQPGAQAGAKPADGDVTATSFHVARTLRESEEAKISRMKRQQLEGTLIERDPAIQATVTAFRQLRDMLMPIGRRLSAKVITMTPREAQLAYESELRASLHSWSERTLLQLTAKLNAPTHQAVSIDLGPEPTQEPADATA